MASSNNNHQLDTQSVKHLFDSRPVVDSVQQPRVDRAIMSIRTLLTDLGRERRNVIKMEENANYNFEVRAELMRWMRTVCHCSEVNVDTFAMALRLFDRSMSLVSSVVDQPVYQLIAAVSILMASKLLDASSISIMGLRSYIYPNIYTSEDFIKVEKLIMGYIQTKKCELYSVGPLDIIPILVYNVSDFKEHCEHIRSKATLLFALFGDDRLFFETLPSLIASALVYRASWNLVQKRERVFNRIVSIIANNAETFREVLSKVDVMIDAWIKKPKDDVLRLPVLHLEQSPNAGRTPNNILMVDQAMDYLF